VYTLVLALYLIGGVTPFGHDLAATHVAGFQTKAACQAALVKANAKLRGQVGPMQEGNRGFVEMRGVCIKVGAAKP
jgi:hypothetical protein